MPHKLREIRLARGWPIGKVERALGKQNKKDLISFLRARYKERFFRPIRLLADAPTSHQGYGLAMMSLCSLLIESIQCLRDGLPTTSDSEWKECDKQNPPKVGIPGESERDSGMMPNAIPG